MHREVPVKDPAKINKYIKELVRRRPDIGNGLMGIKKRLHKGFRFYDVRLLNTKVLKRSCDEFREWLESLIISNPPPEGVVALYFGLFTTDDSLQMYATGSKLWSASDPDWACRNDWRPEGRVLVPAVFDEITKVYSEYNMAGNYIALAYTVMMILDFARVSMISPLDSTRKSMHMACGFDDGDLFDVCVLHEGGLMGLGEARRRGLTARKRKL
jgi:hypothetical protein